MRALLVLSLVGGCATATLDDGEEPGPADAGLPADAGAGADAAPLPPTRYPFDRRHSPITPSVAAAVRAVAARGALAGDVFAKVGDDLTASPAFLTCFAGDGADLGGRDDLAGTLELFRGGDAAGSDPFGRASVAAEAGQGSGWALGGPLEDELAAIDPRYALVLFGTREVTATPEPIFPFAANLLDIVDTLMARGVVPILSTLPPRNDDAAVDAWVPSFNQVVRGVAQGRQVPFVELHRELSPLAGRGLDEGGVLPSIHPAGACVLTTEGLTSGFNVRNLLGLEALDRARRVVAGDAPPDLAGPPLAGRGTAADPHIIDALPFVDLGDTSRSASEVLDAYPACDQGQDESGPEVVYRLRLDRSMRVRALVFDRAGVDVDVHIVPGSAGGTCLIRADGRIDADLPPGTYFFALDSFVSGGLARSGEYLFVLLEIPPLM